MTNLSTALKVLLLFFTTILLGSCAEKESPQPADLSGNWKVISFDDNITLTKVIKTDSNTWTQFNNGDNTVSFIGTDSAVGEITGRNVTNSFSGHFEISADSKIVLNNLVWTKVGEPIWAQLFHSIESAENYKFIGDNLVIYYNQMKNSITLIRTDI
jgi:hypothetical protein